MQRYIPRVKNVQSAAVNLLPSKLIQAHIKKPVETAYNFGALWGMSCHTVAVTKFPRGRCQNVETATKVWYMLSLRLGSWD